jgi:alpha-tubulin suppressor-like RCC1 family protein
MVPLTEHLNVIDVDGGSGHYGFVTEEGEAYTWGYGQEGNLGVILQVIIIKIESKKRKTNIM